MLILYVNPKWRLVNLKYVSQLMGVRERPQRYITAIQDRNQISTNTPQFSKTANLMELLVELPDATGSGKPEMAEECV